MISLGMRVAAARKERGWSQSEVPGVGQRTISGIETGQTSYTPKWRELADSLGIPHEEMRSLMAQSKRDSGKITRIAPAVRDAVRAVNAPFFPPVERASPFSDRLDQVPILGQAIGGDDGRMLFNGSVAGWAPRPVALAGVPDAYAVFVAGESMEPRYRAGETVWVHPRKPPHVGSDVIVQLAPEEDGEAPSGFIKEYRGGKGDNIILRQYNPAKDIPIGRARIISLHTVVLAER